MTEAITVRRYTGLPYSDHENHCCDGCGFRWREVFWNVVGCPNCKAPTHWVASYPFPEQADAHQPFGVAPKEPTA